MEQIMARQIVVETGVCISTRWRRVIISAGTDHTGRTMIAVYGCYFPDPTHADYDKLLENCLARLEPYAEQDYVIIFFSAPMEHEPKLPWIYKAYKSLSRKYKKNIKKLYVTHPSKWFKVLIWIMSKILSHKFAAKVEPIDELADLEKMIPLEKVYVPPAVSGHDRGLPLIAPGQNEEVLPAVTLFGAEIERAVPTGELPTQIERVVKYLEDSGLTEEGLFRLSPDVIEVEKIRMSMDRDYNMDLDKFSPHALAAALKAYFRQLPTPLVPPSTYGSLGGLFDYSEDKDRKRYIKSHVLDELTPQRRKLLGLIMRLLHKTAENAAQNKMHPRNLAAVWTPNLVRCESLQEEMKLLVTSQKFVEVMIQLADELFDDDD